MVQRIACRMLRRLPKTVDLGDLISDGYLGLLQAVDRFDVSKGNPFENFAGPRIRGAILDGLRARDCLPRTFRSTRGPVRKYVPLEDQMLCRTDAPRCETVEALHHSLKSLNRRERLTLQLYDLEGLSMKQIAICLGMTEARVSQLRARTLAALQRQAKPDFRDEKPTQRNRAAVCEAARRRAVPGSSTVA